MVSRGKCRCAHLRSNFSLATYISSMKVMSAETVIFLGGARGCDSELKAPAAA